MVRFEIGLRALIRLAKGRVMPAPPPYAATDPEELTIRDHLARDRTLLANERTLLSYFRTGFGFVAGGVTLVKFFSADRFLFVMGFVLIGLGGVTSVLGCARYFIISRRLKTILLAPRGTTTRAEFDESIPNS